MGLWDQCPDGSVEPNGFTVFTIILTVIVGVLGPAAILVLGTIAWAAKHLTPIQGIFLAIGSSWLWLGFLWLRHRRVNRLARVKHEINRSI
jgi:hypothetical protein